MKRRILLTCLSAVTIAATTPARADIPVIDMAAIANLIEQINYWQAQIKAMSNQLVELKQTHDAMTGPRGMEGLLRTSSSERNYLPLDEAELAKTVSGTSTAYAGLAEQIRTAMAANAVIPGERLSELSPQLRETVESERRSAAALSTLSQTAYTNTGRRFAALQALIDTIGTAGDVKAIQDLQGRINSEQVMLQNEQIKLQTLYQVSAAQQRTNEQRTRERAIVDIGSARSLRTVDY
jgi:type IV secretion system protein VirB5